MGILDDLFGSPADPNAIDPSTGLTQKQAYDSRMNALGSMGGILLAAGQPMGGADRGRILAQLGNVPGQISEMQSRLLQNNALARNNQNAANAAKILQGPDMQKAIAAMPDNLRPVAQSLAASGSPDALMKLQEFMTPKIDSSGNYYNMATGVAGNIYTPGMERKIGTPGSAPGASAPATLAGAPAVPAGAPAVPAGTPAATVAAPTTPAATASAPKGEDVFKALNVPASVQSQVRAIVRGDDELPEGKAGLSTPQGMYLRQLVSMYDPDGFNNIVNGVRRKTQLDFSASGNSGQQLGSAEKVINHTVELQKAANDLFSPDSTLSNGQYPLFNEAKQAIATNTGDPRVTNFDQWRTTVSDELGKFLKGTGGLTDKQIEAVQKDIGSTASPDQMQKSIDNVFSIMQGQIVPKLAQYKATMGRDYNDGQVFGKDTMDKLDYINSHPVPGSAKAQQIQAANGGVPQGAVDMLKSNPSLAASFDAKYGADASKRFLGQ